MNITELARKLKIPTSELREKLPEMGFDIGVRAIKIDDTLAQKVIQKFQATKKTQTKDHGLKIIEKKLQGQTKTPEEIPKKEAAIPPSLTVNEFAKALNLPVTKIITELMKNGIMAAMNQTIDFETATIIAQDLGFTVTEKDQEQERNKEQEQQIDKLLAEQDKKKLLERAPVVVVMGHVDHGKTRLLDAIRKTNIIDTEAGGITQHIGAYQVKDNDRLITFLDTPGHEAFSAMRSRGGKIADIAIIVVAADDGIQPQTLEAISIAQKEDLPFIIAINKIDKPEADIDRIKTQLSEINLNPEDWGGKTICVPISAKQNTGIKELLDLILLVADMEELKANPNGSPAGTIIESHIDKGAGPLATVLIQTGTLKTGDQIIIGSVIGKIKSMRNYAGKNLNSAEPSVPVQIMGLKSAPQVGDILTVQNDSKKFRRQLKKSYRFSTISPIINTNEITNENEDTESFPIVLKTDVLGSLEAIEEAILKIKTEDSKIKIIKKGLGNIAEDDIKMATGAKGQVLGFHVKTSPKINELANEKQVIIKHFTIIYDLLNYLKEELGKILKPQIVRTAIGQMKVVAIFRTENKGMIVGGKVTNGTIKPNTKAKIIRNEEEITRGNVTEIRSGKELLNEAAPGSECGIKYQGEPVIQVGDVLEVYTEELQKREVD